MMKSRIPAMVTIPHRRTVFRPNWQFAIDRSPAHRPGELYDLKTDPNERVNLYSDQPQLVAELARQLEDWARRTGDGTAIDLARNVQG
jgi:hypothetical protein